MKFSQTKRYQCGAIASYMILILVIIAGGLVVTSLIISSASLNDTSQQIRHIQALNLAESKLEHINYQLNDGTGCTSLPIPDTQTISSDASFELQSSIDNAGDCDVTVIGNKQNVVTLIDAKFKNFGGTGAGLANYNETFPDATDFLSKWSTEVLTATKGSIAWDALNALTPGTGSFYAKTFGAKTATLTGYREMTISEVSTGATSLSVDITGFYRKASSKGTNPRRQKVWIYLVDINGNTTTLWKHITLSTADVWKTINATKVLPKNRTYNRVRIKVNMRAKKRRQPWIWIDELKITNTFSGGSVPDWKIVEWQEVNN